MIRQTLSVLSIFFVLAIADKGVAQTLVPNSSSWRFLHPTNGVDPATEVEQFHTTFYKMDFDDSKWKEGNDKPGKHGGFGYGDEGFEGVDIGTPESPPDRKTAYFRLKFTTDQDYENLVLQCQRDDGIIVYLDGVEVMRDNIQRGRFGIGKGKEAYDLFAQQTISEAKETEVNSYPLDPELSAGDHILAISLHNRPQGSSDLRIAEISLSVRPDDESEEQEDQEEKE